MTKSALGTCQKEYNQSKGKNKLLICTYIYTYILYSTY